jgi:hypothetical protein
MANNRLQQERDAISPLLAPEDPGDALTAYYALHHMPTLTHLRVHYETVGRADGFLAICTTGADLFRPLVVLRAQTDNVLRELLRAGLTRGRPYHVIAPVLYASTLREEMRVAEERVGLILAMDRAVFQPVINVLVMPAPGVAGALRYEIRSQDRVMAAAGTNWRSPRFAEIYVFTEPVAQGRGWGKSVASACTAALLEQGVQPLYVVAEGDQVSVGLAEGLGYRDSGRQEYIAMGARA